MPNGPEQGGFLTEEEKQAAESFEVPTTGQQKMPEISKTEAKETEDLSSPEKKGQNWIDQQKDNLKEFALSFFTTGQEDGMNKFMNVVGKTAGMFLTGVGSYVMSQGDKIVDLSHYNSGAGEVLGATLLVMGLTGIAGATFESWSDRHKYDEIGK